MMTVGLGVVVKRICLQLLSYISVENFLHSYASQTKQTYIALLHYLARNISHCKLLFHKCLKKYNKNFIHDEIDVSSHSSLTLFYL